MLYLLSAASPALFLRFHEYCETLLLSAWCLVVREDAIPKQRYLFLAALGLTALLALQNGDIGSRMVYEHGAAVQPVVESQSAGESGGESGGHEGHSH